jgi:hypothetical protein
MVLLIGILLVTTSMLQAQPSPEQINEMIEMMEAQGNLTEEQKAALAMLRNLQGDIPTAQPDAEPAVPSRPVGPAPESDPTALSAARTAFETDPTLANKYLLIDQLRADAIIDVKSDLLKDALILASQAPAIDGAQLDLLLEEYRKLSLRTRHLELVDQIETGQGIDPNLTPEDLLLISGDIGLTAKLYQHRGNDTRADALRYVSESRYERLSATTLYDLTQWLAPLVDQAPLYHQAALRYPLVQMYQRYLLVATPNDPGYTQAKEALLAQFALLNSGTTDASTAPLERWLALPSILPIEDIPNSNRWEVDPRTNYLTSSAKLTMGRFPLEIGAAEYDLQIRFRMLSDRTGLHIFLPVDTNRVGRFSMDRRQSNLNDATVKPGGAIDLAVHTVTIHVRRRLDGQYLMSADMDGQPYFAPMVLAGTQENRLPTIQRTLAKNHILLRSLSGQCEIHAVNLKMISGTATVPTRQQAATNTGTTREIDLTASEPWQWIMQVRPGDALQITAEGEWSPAEDVTVGPEGDDFGWYALRGRLVESDKTFNVGDSTVIIIQRDDILKLEMDDSNKADNSGQMHVTLQLHSLPDPDELAQSIDDAADPFAGLVTPVTTATEDMTLLFGTSGRYTTDQARQMLTLAQQMTNLELKRMMLSAGSETLLGSDESFPLGAIPLLIEIDPERFDTARDTLLAQCRDELAADATPQAQAAMRAIGNHFTRQRQWDAAIECYQNLTPPSPDDTARLAILELCRDAATQWEQTPTDTAARDQYVALLLVFDTDITAGLSFDSITHERLATRLTTWDDLRPEDALALAQWYTQLAQTELPTTVKALLFAQAQQYCSEALVACDPAGEIGQAASALHEQCYQSLGALGADARRNTLALGRRRWIRSPVQANFEWQAVVPLKAGDTVTLDATGYWTVYFQGGQAYICGPAGKVFVEGDPVAGDLIYRLGEGESVHLGEHGEFTADANVTLMLRINDETPGNNLGRAMVTITITPAPTE